MRKRNYTQDETWNSLQPISSAGGFSGINLNNARFRSSDYEHECMNSLTETRLIINGAIGNTFQCKLNQSTTIFIQVEMPSGKWQPFCVGFNGVINLTKLTNVCGGEIKKRRLFASRSIAVQDGCTSERVRIVKAYDVSFLWY